MNSKCPVCGRKKDIAAIACPRCTARISEEDSQRTEFLRRNGDSHASRLDQHIHQVVLKLKDAHAEGKPFGYDVEILCHGMPMRRTFHWRGNEAAVRRKARLQSTFRQIDSLTPLTRDEWIRAYGLGKM